MCEIWVKNLVSPSFAAVPIYICQSRFRFIIYHLFCILQHWIATGVLVKVACHFVHRTNLLSYYRFIYISSMRWLGIKKEESDCWRRNARHHWIVVVANIEMSSYFIIRTRDYIVLSRKFTYSTLGMGKPNQKTGCKWILLGLNTQICSETAPRSKNSEWSVLVFPEHFNWKYEQTRVLPYVHVDLCA